MSNIKKLTIAGILVAMGVVCSAFYIPIGVAKCFPIQALINVLGGVLLGPLYAVCMAFTTSLVRVMLGTGSLLAFPGSMFGALLCGILYKYTKNTVMACIGEVFGTGIIGSIAAYPIATIFLSKTAALFGFVIPFGLSSIVGAAVSFVLLKTLKRTRVLNAFNFNEKSGGI